MNVIMVKQREGVTLCFVYEIYIYLEYKIEDASMKASILSFTL